ncbi:MAG: hypothetical protein LIO97_11385, partial [Tannerellaceae bacterium]|nr:hypothetical protein [Tannerellaceae bacterium]
MNNPVMEETLRETDLFIRTYNNQKNFSKLNAEGFFKVSPVWDIFQLSAFIGVNHFISNGKEYRHTYT